MAAPDRFDVEALIGRLSGEPPENRGRRVLVTGLQRADRAPELAKALGRALAARQRAVLVSVDAGETPDTRSGFTDLVLGETSFAEAIVREDRSRLHVVGAGFLAGMLLVEDARAVDAVLQAFDQTYDWVVCLLHDGADTGLMGLMAPRADAVVIVSDEDAESPALIDFYERAKAAGAPDVVVARKTEPAEADLVAA